MLKNWSYKQKLKMLGALGLVFIVASYKLAISNSLKEYNTFKQFESNNNMLSTTTVSLQSLQLKQENIAAILDAFVLDTIDNSKNLLSIVSAYCDKKNVALKEYKPLFTNDYDSLTVSTRLVTVEGNFIDCLKLHYQLETQFICGRITSVLYKSYINPKDKTTHLNCSIYLQNIIGHEKPQ